MADGRQRLTTAKKILEHPKEFGLTDVEAVNLMQQCTVFVSKTTVETHAQASLRFIALNMYGTFPTSAEIFKAKLLYPNGVENPNAPVFMERLNALMQSIGEQYTREARNKNGKDYQSKMQRGAYAIFYKWLTKSSLTTMWRYMQGRINNIGEKSAEELLGIEIAQWDKRTIDRALADFEKDILSFSEDLKTNVIEYATTPPTMTLWYYLISQYVHCSIVPDFTIGRARAICYLVLKNSRSGTTRLNISSSNQDRQFKADELSVKFLESNFGVRFTNTGMVSE